jgi:hypothetical protein
MKTTLDRCTSSNRTKIKFEIKNRKYLLIYKAAAPYPPTATLSAK